MIPIPRVQVRRTTASLPERRSVSDVRGTVQLFDTRRLNPISIGQGSCTGMVHDRDELERREYVGYLAEVTIQAGLLLNLVLQRIHRLQVAVSAAHAARHAPRIGDTCCVLSDCLTQRWIRDQLHWNNRNLSSLRLSRLSRARIVRSPSVARWLEDYRNSGQLTTEVTHALLDRNSLYVMRPKHTLGSREGIPVVPLIPSKSHTQASGQSRRMAARNVDAAQMATDEPIKHQSSSRSPHSFVLRRSAHCPWCPCCPSSAPFSHLSCCRTRPEAWG
jgi:hypothetical protein